MEKDFLIYKNTLIEYNGNKTIVKIPNGITSIDEYCFLSNKSIKKVILPPSVKEIAYSAFENCKNLSEINLENVEIIKRRAFINCINLKEINIDKVTKLEPYAFDNTGITKLKIPKGIKLGTETEHFNSCKNLEKIEINCELNDINKKIFAGCESIKELIINNKLEFDITNCGSLSNLEKIEIKNPNYKIKDGIMYSADEKRILKCPANIKLTEYKIPDTVVEIGPECFLKNKNIEKITFGKNIKKINKFAFTRSNIENLKINEAISEIGINSFLETNKLKELDLSKTNILNLNIDKIGINETNKTKILIIPNEIKEIIIDINLDNVELKYISNKNKLDKKVLNILNRNNCKFNKTLDELIEEGKTFKEASVIIKELQQEQ